MEEGLVWLGTRPLKGTLTPSLGIADTYDRVFKPIYWITYRCEYHAEAQKERPSESLSEEDCGPRTEIIYSIRVHPLQPGFFVANGKQS